MFLRANRRTKDGKDHTLLVAGGDRPHSRRPAPADGCYLGELNTSAAARWRKTIQLVQCAGRGRQLALFPAERRAPGTTRGRADPPGSGAAGPARGSSATGWLGWHLWQRLGLHAFCAPHLDGGLRQRCRGRGSLRSWRSTASAPPGANWRSRRAGTAPPRLDDLWGSRRPGSTPTGSIAAWTSCSRTRRRCSSTWPPATASCSAPSTRCCCTTSRARTWRARPRAPPDAAGLLAGPPAGLQAGGPGPCRQPGGLPARLRGLRRESARRDHRE